MRVLFVTNRYPTAEMPGDSPCIAEQKAALEQLGYDIDVLHVNSVRSKWYYLKAVWQVFWATHIRRRYDLIHAHYGSYCGLVACTQFCTPVIVTFRGSDLLDSRQRRISRFVEKRSSKAIVMTREMRDVLGQSDAHIIPYGIDLRLFRPRPQVQAREALGLPLDSPIVFFPYDPERQLKRFEIVQDAVALLAKEFPKLRVAAIHSESHETVATYMSACDVLVLTSDYEGSPVAVREAVACDLPVVSVDVGDVSEVIGGIKGCYLVNRDPREVAEKLRIVLRARQRTDGHLFADELGASKVARKVAAAYESVTGGKAHDLDRRREDKSWQRDVVKSQSE